MCCADCVPPKPQDGFTPLMLAAEEGNLPVARLLVETYHCDVNEEHGEVSGWEVMGRVSEYSTCVNSHLWASDTGSQNTGCSIWPNEVSQCSIFTCYAYHVHRIHSLPFTGLPLVAPLSVWSTCCPTLETGSLWWMQMVARAFTMQLKVVASQWWGTSWTSVDLTSAWEMEWVMDWKMTLCAYTNACLLCKAWWMSLRHKNTCTDDTVRAGTKLESFVTIWSLPKYSKNSSFGGKQLCHNGITNLCTHTFNDTHTHVHSCIEGRDHQCGSCNLSYPDSTEWGSAPCGTMSHYMAALSHSPTLR